MYSWLLIAHSAWRWMVIFAGLATIVHSATGLVRHGLWEPLGPRLATLFSRAVDVQVVLGAALYLVVSPLTTLVASAATTALPPESEARFFSVLHPLIMVAALVLVHLSSSITRRATTSRGRLWRALCGGVVVLLVLNAGLPWWRPWLRL